MSDYLAPFLDDEEFVTALLVDASDPAVLTFVSCGHPQPMLVRSNGAVSLPELPTQLPLGLGDRYAATQVPWQPDDRVLMYTDGLSEARDARGRFFSPIALAQAIARHELDEALDAAIAAVRAHVPNGQLTDDLAVLLLHNRGTPGTSTPQHADRALLTAQ